MAAQEARRVVELHQLPAHRLGDLAPRMAGRRGEQARGAVQDLAAGLVVVVDALRQAKIAGCS